MNITTKVELKTWEEHIKEKEALYNQRYVKTGIACPNCGEELSTDSMLSFTTWPPKRSYYCFACDWTDTD